MMQGDTLTRLAAGAILAGVGGLALARLALPATAAPAPIEPHIAMRPLPIDARTTVAAAPVRPAAPQSIAITHVIDTGGPLRYGAYFWDSSAAAPAGPITIAIDLKAATLSVFRGGYEIGTTAVIYGADAKQTPLGTFPILQKDRHHFSSTYHHAPMPFTLRLTGDGVSIHASEVDARYATHGCIGVPAGFARRLFEAASVGDHVIVTNRGAAGGDCLDRHDLHRIERRRAQAANRGHRRGAPFAQVAHDVGPGVPRKDRQRVVRRAVVAGVRRRAGGVKDRDRHDHARRVRDQRALFTARMSAACGEAPVRPDPRRFVRRPTKHLNRLVGDGPARTDERSTPIAQKRADRLFRPRRPDQLVHIPAPVERGQRAAGPRGRRLPGKQRGGEGEDHRRLSMRKGPPRRDGPSCNGSAVDQMSSPSAPLTLPLTS